MTRETVPERPQGPVEGFPSPEELSNLDILKNNNTEFARFFDRVFALRSHPEEMQKVREQVEQFDRAKNKNALRFGPAGADALEWSAKLFALFAEKVEIKEVDGKKGFFININFGDCNYAEDSAVGAGHLLTGAVTEIGIRSSETEQFTSALRHSGARGGEYHSSHYEVMYSHYDIFVPFEKIVVRPASVALQQRKIEEKKASEYQQVLDKSQKARRELSVKVVPDRPLHLVEGERRTYQDDIVRENFRTGQKNKLPVRVNVGGSDRVLWIGSSSVVGLYRSRHQLIPEGGGFIGVSGHNYVGILNYLQKNWNKMEILFSEGQKCILTGAAINIAIGSKSPEQFAQLAFRDLERLGLFLKQKAAAQGKNIHILFATTAPFDPDIGKTPAQKEQSARKSRGIRLLAEMIQNSDHYYEPADLFKRIATADGHWRPEMRGDQFHVQHDVLRQWALSVQRSV